MSDRATLLDALHAYLDEWYARVAPKIRQDDYASLKFTLCGERSYGADENETPWMAASVDEELQRPSELVGPVPEAK